MAFGKWNTSGELTWANGDTLTHTDLNDSIDETTPPIGAVMAWFKSLTGVPATLPSGWVECNGQTLSDADSPLNGRVIPNLNGDDAFLRGDATSSSSATAGVANATSGTNTTGAHSYHGAGVNNTESHTQSLGDHAHTLTGMNYYTTVWIMRIK